MERPLIGYLDTGQDSCQPSQLVYWASFEEESTERLENDEKINDPLDMGPFEVFISGPMT